MFVEEALSNHEAKRFAIDLVGYLAAATTFAAFYCRSMLPLRCAAIGANLLFILYGWLLDLKPILFLHTLLLPLNLARLADAWQDRLRRPRARQGEPKVTITLVFALSLGLVATPPEAAGSLARSSAWELNACHAWRDHLHFIIDLRERTGLGKQIDLESVREAVVSLGRRCDSGDAREAARLLSLLLNLLTEDEEDDA